jgi:hypothetical protein
LLLRNVGEEPDYVASHPIGRQMCHEYMAEQPIQLDTSVIADACTFTQGVSRDEVGCSLSDRVCNPILPCMGQPLHVSVLGLRGSRFGSWLEHLSNFSLLPATPRRQMSTLFVSIKTAASFGILPTSSFILGHAVA